METEVLDVLTSIADVRQVTRSVGGTASLCAILAQTPGEVRIRND